MVRMRSAREGAGLAGRRKGLDPGCLLPKPSPHLSPVPEYSAACHRQESDCLRRWYLQRGRDFSAITAAFLRRNKRVYAGGGGWGGSGPAGTPPRAWVGPRAPCPPGLRAAASRRPSRSGQSRARGAAELLAGDQHGVTCPGAGRAARSPGLACGGVVELPGGAAPSCRAAVSQVGETGRALPARGCRRSCALESLPSSGLGVRGFPVASAWFLLSFKCLWCWKTSRCLLIAPSWWPHLRVFPRQDPSSCISVFIFGGN